MHAAGRTTPFATADRGMRHAQQSTCLEHSEATYDLDRTPVRVGDAGDTYPSPPFVPHHWRDQENHDGAQKYETNTPGDDDERGSRLRRWLGGKQAGHVTRVLCQHHTDLTPAGDISEERENRHEKSRSKRERLYGAEPGLYAQQPESKSDAGMGPAGEQENSAASRPSPRPEKNSRCGKSRRKA